MKEGGWAAVPRGSRELMTGETTPGNPVGPFPNGLLRRTRKRKG